MLQLYKNIKSRRQELGMTQKELADKIGYSKSMVTKIENGEVDISQSKIMAFAQALHTTPGELMGEDDYYLDPETAQIAQDLFDNHKLRMLFDAARTATPEDLETTYNMLMALKRKEDDTD